MIVGIVGGGQLARMLALAGYPLGLQFLILDPVADACAGQVAELIQGAYDDPVCLAQLAERADVITFDFENVPADAVRDLQIEVFPPPNALSVAQDRLHEKTLFQELSIPTPAFADVLSLDDLIAAVDEIGLPAVLKTRRLGYDGKGQRILHNPNELAAAYDALGNTPLILEQFIAFEREVSILAVRGKTGEIVFYPLAENEHQEGILHLSRAPFESLSLTAQAQDYVTRLLEHLDYCGVLALELFVADSELLANEIAPRVHNSGHWTIEGAETSQFENHLRAGLGLPLGATTARGHSAMLNCIGELAQQEIVLTVPGAHFHDYGKAARAGRKVGHITLRADDANILRQRLAQLRSS